MKKISRIFLTILGGLCSFPSIASAIEYSYDFSLISTDFNGSGIFTSLDGSGDLTLDSASGVINGNMIFGLSDWGNADNIFYQDNSVDYGGISFATKDGDFYNIFYAGVGHNNGPELDADFTLSVIPHIPLGSAVPESASWAMMLLGLGIVGYTKRRYQTIDATTSAG